MMKGKCTRLSAIALGVAFGVVSALFMMIFAWSVWMNGTTSPIIDQWAAIYPGYAATLKGGFIGGAWGFVEGFICGLVVGWVYNLCLCCCSCCCGKPSCQSCGMGRCGCGKPNCPACNPTVK